MTAAHNKLSIDKTNPIEEFGLVFKNSAQSVLKVQLAAFGRYWSISKKAASFVGFFIWLMNWWSFRIQAYICTGGIIASDQGLWSEPKQKIIRPWEDLE